MSTETTGERARKLLKFRMRLNTSTVGRYYCTRFRLRVSGAYDLSGGHKNHLLYGYGHDDMENNEKPLPILLVSAM